jgi:phosphate transport system permease protein
MMNTEVAASPVSPSPVGAKAQSGTRLGDRVFHLICLAGALVVGVLLALVLWQLFKGSGLAMKQFGWKFFTGREWNPVTGEFGALTYIFGTII